MWSCDLVFSPSMQEDERLRRIRGWSKAVSRSLDWEES